VNEPSRAGLVIGCAVGGPLIVVGLVELVLTVDATQAVSFLQFFVGSDIVHDAIVAPIAGLLGVVVVRRLPAATRAPFRAALFGSAIVIAVAWPALRGYGRLRAPDNTTVQPLDYATAVITVIAVVWTVCALWWVSSALRARRRPTG